VRIRKVTITTILSLQINAKCLGALLFHHLLFKAIATFIGTLKAKISQFSEVKARETEVPSKNIEQNAAIKVLDISSCTPLLLQCREMINLLQEAGAIFNQSL
jgi:hypothetical protein